MSAPQWQRARCYQRKPLSLIRWFVVGIQSRLFRPESTTLARSFPHRRRCGTAAKPAMELMLRFCDGGVVVIAVLSGDLSTIASVFLPVPVLAPKSFPGHPEELPRLDIPFDQDLVSQPHSIRRSRIREQKTRPRR